MLDEFWALITGFSNVEVSDTLLSSFETLVEGNCFQIFAIINNTINISVVFWEWNFWIQGYINLTLRYIPNLSKRLYQFKVSIELHVCLSHTLRITKLIKSSQFNTSKMLSCFILHFSMAEVKHEKCDCTKAFRLLVFMLFPHSFFTRHFLTSLCHLSSTWEQSGGSICKPSDRLSVLADRTEKVVVLHVHPAQACTPLPSMGNLLRRMSSLWPKFCVFNYMPITQGAFSKYLWNKQKEFPSSET